MSAKRKHSFGNFTGELEEVQCALCGNRGKPKTIFRSADGIGFHRCLQCGLLYASPRFTESSLLGIYETESFAEKERFEGWAYEKWSETGDRTYVTQTLKIDLVRRFLPEGSSLLDVGCAQGLFVVHAQIEGYDCLGLEPSKALCDIATQVVGARVVMTEIEEFSSDRQFDGVILWDVIEHLYDPVGLLKRCAGLLKPGGYLFAQVPNYRGIANSIKTLKCRLGLKRDFKHFGFPWHIYSFDRESLGNMMSEAGLDAVLFESWPHQYKRGDKGPVASAMVGLAKKFCLTDYIVSVARNRL